MKRFLIFVFGFVHFFVFVGNSFSMNGKMMNAILISYMGDSDRYTPPILISDQKWKQNELEFKFGKLNLITQIETSPDMINQLKGVIVKQYKQNCSAVFGNVFEFRLINCSNEGDYLPNDFERSHCEQTLYIDHKQIEFLIDFLRSHSKDFKNDHAMEDTLKNLEYRKNTVFPNEDHANQ